MDIIYEILVHGDEAIAWVGAFLGGLVIKYVVQRIENETAQAYLGRAVGEVFAAVEEVYQTYVAALKAGSADGELTDHEKAEAKSLAIQIAKTNLGAKGLARLARILGIASIDGWLSTRIEASVNSLKIAGRTKEVVLKRAPLPLRPQE